VTVPEPFVAADLADVLAIYEEAFPANERVPTAVLAAELGRSRSCLVLHAEGRVVAFACLVPLAPDTQFLEYLAVRSGARGDGYGARMVGAAHRGPFAGATVGTTSAKAARSRRKARCMRYVGAMSTGPSGAAACPGRRSCGAAAAATGVTVCLHRRERRTDCGRVGRARGARQGGRARDGIRAPLRRRPWAARRSGTVRG
jgi:hypothetical protein